MILWLNNINNSPNYNYCLTSLNKKGVLRRSFTLESFKSLVLEVKEVRIFTGYKGIKKRVTVVNIENHQSFFLYYSTTI